MKDKPKKRKALDFSGLKMMPYGEALRMAKEITTAPRARYERRRVSFLIDVFGVYLGVTRWMNATRVPITTAELPARIAMYLIWEAADVIKTREHVEFSAPGTDFERVLSDLLVRMGDDDLPSPTSVNHLDISFELFYAPSPLKDFERALRVWGKDRADFDERLEQLRNGIIDIGYEQRDYRIYDDFIATLTKELSARSTDPGFYNFFVKRDNPIRLDEKEVDIHLAIRAMDICAGEADAVCIVSSDQDFTPLHHRLRDSGLNTYHADVGKFDDQRNIGRKIREMGEDHIPIQINVDMLRSLIGEHVGLPVRLHLDGEQYSAIWDAFHNLGGRF